MLNKRRISRFAVSFAVVISFSVAGALQALGGPLPKYTQFVAGLESQRIAGAQLVYFDQSLADLLGVKVPPGRTGLPGFDKAVLDQFALEVKEGTPVHNTNLARLSETENSAVKLFVEKDAHGGSGRAAYFEVSPGVWINAKGVGITGQGNTRNIVPAPPANTFTSHRDGSMTLEEAIKEAIYARVADANLSSGGSRVLAIIYTGRTLSYPDGNKVPLATVIRAPIQRMDRAQDPSFKTVDFELIASALAEANMLRVMKGDFVNASNMGARGEMIDFGTMTHTGGFNRAESSQRREIFYEGSSMLDRLQEQTYQDMLGKHLLRQLGIPEEYLTSFSTADFRRLTSDIRGLIKGIAQLKRLDFEPVAEADLNGTFVLHHYFQDLAADFFRNAEQAQDEYVNSQTARAANFTTRPLAEESKPLLDDLLRHLYQLMRTVVRDHPETAKPEFADAVRKIAHFKNRDIHDLLRPTITKMAGDASNNFVGNKLGFHVQSFIDRIVTTNRLATKAGADSNLIVDASSRATHLYIRAFEENGVKRIFSHPELIGASGNLKMSFRVSTDGWKTYQDLDAEFKTSVKGDYFVVTIPHGTMPVTDSGVELAPFVRNSPTHKSWLAEDFNIRGPPLLLNERLGLKPDFVRKAGVMRQVYATPITFGPDELPGCDHLLTH